MHAHRFLNSKENKESVQKRRHRQGHMPQTRSGELSDVQTLYGCHHMPQGFEGYDNNLPVKCFIT